MPISHLLLAILVAAIWGCNFIFIKFGLEEVSPLLFCSLRFFLAWFPAIFFIKRPNVPFKIVALYGLVLFGLQFIFVFTGMYLGMTAGLAAILLQTQVFFSVLFAFLFLKETPTLWQILGGLISFTGISVVALHLDQNATLLGFLLIIAGAASWGMGNLISKKLSKVNAISLVVWGSFAASFPLFSLSLIFEGPKSIVQSYHQFSSVGLMSIMYIVYMSTWVGYGVWNWLLSRHPISTIAPFTLLVPLFAMLSSALVLDEPIQSWKILAGLLVIGGLCINLLGSRYFTKYKSSFGTYAQSIPPMKPNK